MADKPDGKDGLTRTDGALTDSEDGLTSEDSKTESESGGMTRRSMLRGCAAAGALGLVGTASAQSEDERETVDVVEAGADPNGEEPIDGVLQSVVEDGVVVEFPEDGEFVTNGFDLRANDFELRGNGARLYPEGGQLSIDGRNWTMDGFELDMRSNGAYPTLSCAGGDWTVSRCVWRGKAGAGDGRAVWAKFAADTTAEFVDCYWPDGAVEGNKPSNFGCLGSFMNWENDGHLRLERCWFEGWSKDTTYLSEVSGSIELVDVYMRNTIVGPRISVGSLKRVKSVHTEPIPVEKWSGSSFQSGAWLNGQKGIHGEVLIEDCDFYITGPQNDTPIKGKVMPGPTTIRDTRVHSEGTPQAILLQGSEITLDGVTVSGEEKMTLDGDVKQRDVSFTDEEAADPSPHIPEPPEVGSVPADGSEAGRDDE